MLELAAHGFELFAQVSDLAQHREMLAVEITAHFGEHRVHAGRGVEQAISHNRP
jgi:hypothetical protein